VLHGVPQVNGSPSAFFCFANVPSRVTRRATYLIELVAPSLYAAHLRVLHGEGRHDETKTPRAHARPRVALLPRAITGREVQILQWVQEGKSNREIGEVLKISPLTVKNHVQNILKKLKVRNRAQAVSRAIGARLIQSAASGAPSDRLVRSAQYERDA
jgi:transcriptional regulator EpsA